MCIRDRNSIEDSITLYKAVQEFAEQNNNKFFDYYGTIGKLINEELVPFALLCDWAKIVERMPYFYKTDINKRTCIVVHAGYIESLDNVDTEESYESIEDFYLYARDDAYTVSYTHLHWRWLKSMSANPLPFP